MRMCLLLNARNKSRKQRPMNVRGVCTWNMVFNCCPLTNRSHNNGVKTSKKDTERIVSRAEGTKARPVDGRTIRVVG